MNKLDNTLPSFSTPVKPYDGGPAYPIPPVGTGDPRDGMTTGSEGMSLRDYFAARAMQSLCTLEFKDRIRELHGPEATPEDIESATAQAAYLQADAMLAARTQSPK